LVHWTGVLNLFAIIAATSAIIYLWLGAGWHWYFALLLWPVIYLGIPVAIGLAQGVLIRREFDAVIKGRKSSEP
jgi:hypothetical protein